MLSPVAQCSFRLVRPLLDAMVLAFSAHCVSLFYFHTPLQELASVYTVLLYICCLLIFFLFSKMELYDSWRGRSILSMLIRLVLSWGWILLTGVFLSLLIYRANEISSIWLFYWFIVSALFLAVYRAAAYKAMRYLRAKYKLNIKRVIIIGYGETGKKMHHRALRDDWLGYKVEAIHATPDALKDIDRKNIRYISEIEDIPAYVLANDINEIWITLPLGDVARLQPRLQYAIRNCLVDIRLVLDTSSIQILSNKINEFLGMSSVELNCPRSYGFEGLAKELLDKLLALVFLILLAPLFATLAICIKWSSPGPVFFKQARNGLNGRQFLIYKFRTMAAHAEQDRNTITQARKNDPRVTPIGHFIRRTSIDELPQLINVLKGDMSLVGPRPHAIPHNEQYRKVLDVYMLRHRVKPGITGWAQIHGLRGETDTIDKMAKRVQFDMQYIENWSLWLDIQIILWTAFKGWTGENAY